MTRPRFLADEDLRLEIVSATRRLEPAIEFITAVEAGLGGYSDPQLLEFAASGNWLIVSHDVSTMKFHAAARIQRGQPMPGLFLTRQSSPTRAIAENLVLIWSASTAEEWNDRIVYIPM